MEDITICKREHRGQKELPKLERTLARNGRWFRCEEDKHWTLGHDKSKTTLKKEMVNPLTLNDL
jgi:hypothetical protein